MTEETINAFYRVLPDQNSILYLDTCFTGNPSQGDNVLQTQPGLEFLASFKDEILTRGKSIVVMRYVKDELEKYAQKNHVWAINTLNFIKKNKHLFTLLEKTETERHLDTQKGRQRFADEALRQQFLSDTSYGKKPVLLSADFGLARTASVLDPQVRVFTIDRHNLGEPSVREWDEFLSCQKDAYLSNSFPLMMKGCDVVLTSSALRADNFPYFLEMLEQYKTDDQRLPIYIHKQSYMSPNVKTPNLNSINHKINFVEKDEYADELNCLVAEYSARNSGRHIVLVGLENDLLKIKERIDTCKPSHLNGSRRDGISYYMISPLGRLVPTKKIPGAADLQQIKEAAWKSHMNTTSTSTATNRKIDELMRSADKGNTDAMGLIAQMYKLGVFLPQSDERYQEWHNRQLRAGMEKIQDSYKTPTITPWQRLTTLAHAMFKQTANTLA